MTLPLVVLAAGSIFAGWLGAPEYLWGSLWNQWLQPIFGGVHEAAHGSLSDEINLTLFTACDRWTGFLLAYFAYGRASKLPDRLASWQVALLTACYSTNIISMSSMTFLSCGPLPIVPAGWLRFSTPESSMDWSMLWRKAPEVSA